MMKITYRVRIIGNSSWQASYKTLDEAIARAKSDIYFKDDPQTIIEKIITEKVWQQEK
jgi:hypothetical protein